MVRYYLVFTQLQQVPLPAATLSNNDLTTKKLNPAPPPSKPPYAPKPSLDGSVPPSQTPAKLLSPAPSLSKLPPHLSPSHFPSLKHGVPSVPPPSISTSSPSSTSPPFPPRSSPSSPPSLQPPSSPAALSFTGEQISLSFPGGPLLVSLAELAMLPPHAPPNKVGKIISPPYIVTRLKSHIVTKLDVKSLNKSYRHYPDHHHVYL